MGSLLQTMPVLADEADMIVFVVFLAIAFISWLVKAISKSGEKEGGQKQTAQQKKESIEAFLESMLKGKKAGGSSRTAERPSHSPPPPPPPPMQRAGAKRPSISDFVRPAETPERPLVSEPLTPQSLTASAPLIPETEPLGTLQPSIEALDTTLPSEEKKVVSRHRMKKAAAVAAKAPATASSQAQIPLQLDNVGSLRKAIILQTVLSPPKSLQRENNLWDE